MRFILPLLLLLASCDESSMCQHEVPAPVDPISHHQVKLLFEHEGCKVYGFVTDPGRMYERSHFFSHCTGPSTVMTTEKSGKTTYPDSIPTSVEP